MKIKMKLKEKQLNEYRTKHKKDWHSYVLAGDAFLAGYRQALCNIFSSIPEDNVWLNMIDSGNDVVEVDIKDGDHQIGAKLSG